MVHRCKKEQQELSKEKANALSEPVRDCLLGIPGAGKSTCIKLMRRFFEECLGWEHGVQFLCVAFQNRVARAMGGVTIHSGGGVSVGGGDRSLSRAEVDVLFTRNQAVRWLLTDEVGMVADGLLRASEMHLIDALRK